MNESPVQERAHLSFDTIEQLGEAIAQRPYARRGVPMATTPIRVLIVDRYRLLRAALKALLRRVPDVLVVGEVPGGQAAMAAIAETHPAVVIVDCVEAMQGGLEEIVTAATGLAEPAGVLVLSQREEDSHILPLLRMGIAGYLMMDAAEGDLLDAIRVVASGDVYLRPAAARHLAAVRATADQSAQLSDRDRLQLLSARERTVLQLTAEGFNGPEIGRRLGITAKTVDTYKQRIEDKLGFAHRSEYIRFALRTGLIEIPLRKQE